MKCQLIVVRIMKQRFDRQQSIQEPETGRSESDVEAREKHVPLRRIRRQRRMNRRKVIRRRRLLFWSQITIAALLFITAGLIIRSLELATIEAGGISWTDELRQGHYALAFDKFSNISALALDRAFSEQLSMEELQQQFQDALPHLKKAGYTLTELEVELGIPPKLIPHFHHDRSVHLNMDMAIAEMGDNNIGVMLIRILAHAGEIQGELNMADLPFDDIEVELGAIPSVKLQYVQSSVQ